MTSASRIVPLIIASALFMENMDSTVIATSLPAIARDLGTNPIVLKLAFTTYLLSLTVFIPTSGWLAVLEAAQWWRTETQLTPMDFTIAFAVVAICSLAALPQFFHLKPDAGSSVSGNSGQTIA